jgi:hypothetical protein
VHGLPVAFALAGAKADERDVLLSVFAAEPGPAGRPPRPGPHRRQELPRPRLRGPAIAEEGIRRLRPARKGEPPRAGAQYFKPLRQVSETVSDTFKGQLNLERHGGYTPGGVIVRVLQRSSPAPPPFWHNDTTGQPILRSLTAYDHRPLGIDHLVCAMESEWVSQWSIGSLAGPPPRTAGHRTQEQAVR